MWNIGQLFLLTDNTDGAAVDQVQQQHILSLSYIDLHWVNICLQVSCPLHVVVRLYVLTDVDTCFLMMSKKMLNAIKKKSSEQNNKELTPPCII